MTKYTPYMPDVLRILNKITSHYTYNYALLTKKKVKMAGRWTQCQSIAGLRPNIVLYKMKITDTHLYTGLVKKDGVKQLFLS